MTLKLISSLLHRGFQPNFAQR